MKHSLIALSLALAGLLLSSGCLLSIGGGERYHRRPVVEPTLGKQLLDLQRARDAGALSPEEYDEKKAELME